jgi:hypothetical protein
MYTIAIHGGTGGLTNKQYGRVSDTPLINTDMSRVLRNGEGQPPEAAPNQKMGVDEINQLQAANLFSSTW